MAAIIATLALIQNSLSNICTKDRRYRSASICAMQMCELCSKQMGLFHYYLSNHYMSSDSGIITHEIIKNEQIPLVYLVPNQCSEYAYIQNRYLQCCEIAVRTVTHTTDTDSDIQKWFWEIKQCRAVLHTHTFCTNLTLAFESWMA